jgi:hypothetical protein
MQQNDLQGEWTEMKSRMAEKNPLDFPDATTGPGGTTRSMRHVSMRRAEDTILNSRSTTSKVKTIDIARGETTRSNQKPDASFDRIAR